MSYLRWAATVLAFPIGGWTAAEIAGDPTSVFSAALAAFIAGTVVGIAQWAAVSRHLSWRWVGGTAAGFTVGAASSSIIFHGSIALLDLALTGVLTGILVGLGQGIALHRNWRTTLVWTAMTGLSWGMGWVVSLMVITSNASHYIVFGLSGAAVVTVITGITLRRILGPLRPATTAASVIHAPAGAV